MCGIHRTVTAAALLVIATMVGLNGQTTLDAKVRAIEDSAIRQQMKDYAAGAQQWRRKSSGVVLHG